MPGKREAQYHASILSADLSQLLTADEAPEIRTLSLQHLVMAHPHPSVDAVFSPSRSAPYANLAKQAVAARRYRFRSRAPHSYLSTPSSVDALDVGQRPRPGASK